MKADELLSIVAKRGLFIMATIEAQANIALTNLTMFCFKLHENAEMSIKSIYSSLLIPLILINYS